MHLILIPGLLLFIFGLNSMLSVLLDGEVIFAFSNTLSFLFSWGLIEGGVGSVYSILNICKIAFWVTICLMFLWKLINRLYVKETNSL